MGSSGSKSADNGGLVAAPGAPPIKGCKFLCCYCVDCCDDGVPVAAQGTELGQSQQPLQPQQPQQQQQQQQQPQQSQQSLAQPQDVRIHMSEGAAAKPLLAPSSTETHLAGTEAEGEPELKATIEDAQVSESYRFWEKNKTYKEAKQLSTTNQQKLHKTMKATMKATLGGGELKETVKLPPGEDLNEWIAVNTVHFYNAANMIYGTCIEFCTNETCPTMSAGRNEYLWKDGVKYKKPTRVAAPVYIDELLNWVNDQISDPALFPIDETSKFPPRFMSKVKNMYKRMFRLYAHIYWSHFEKIRSIGANAHLNTCFKHFVYFILEFNLVDDKGLAPLENFINKFRQSDGKQ